MDQVTHEVRSALAILLCMSCFPFHSFTIYLCTQVKKVMNMGFSHEQASIALAACGNNIPQALESLLRKPRKRNPTSRYVEEIPTVKQEKKSPKAEAEDQWVQCEACEKWRRLPPNVDASALPDRWICEMIADGSCNVPEETNGVGMVAHWEAEIEAGIADNVKEEIVVKDEVDFESDHGNRTSFWAGMGGSSPQYSASDDSGDDDGDAEFEVKRKEMVAAEMESDDSEDSAHSTSEAAEILSEVLELKEPAKAKKEKADLPRATKRRKGYKRKRQAMWRTPKSSDDEVQDVTESFGRVTSKTIVAYDDYEDDVWQERVRDFNDYLDTEIAERDSKSLDDIPPHLRSSMAGIQAAAAAKEGVVKNVTRDGHLKIALSEGLELLPYQQECQVTIPSTLGGCCDCTKCSGHELLCVVVLREIVGRAAEKGAVRDLEVYC
jgi:hypothetical protein